MNPSQTGLSFYTNFFCTSVLFIEERDHCRNMPGTWTFTGGEQVGLANSLHTPLGKELKSDVN